MPGYDNWIKRWLIPRKLLSSYEFQIFPSLCETEMCSCAHILYALMPGCTTFESNHKFAKGFWGEEMQTNGKPERHGL